MSKYLHISKDHPDDDYNKLPKQDGYKEAEYSICVGIKFICENEKAGLIRYEGSTGYDIVYPYPEAITINPYEIVKVPCGFKLLFPPEINVNIRSRWGLALKHGVIVLTSPGTIDSSYRAEISVVLFNVSKNAYTINSGDKIAQLCFNYVYEVQFYLTNRLDITDRNEGGFGSTGR